MTSRVLCFSVATNGYQYYYQSNIESHKDYCKRQGYEYISVTKPGLTFLGRESCWLKIALIKEALLAGYDWVICLDADTEIRGHTPPIHYLEAKGKSIYLSDGFSSRFNTGVFIVKRDALSQAFIERLLHASNQPLPKQCQVGWGENGHLIRLANGSSIVQRISRRWNNNSEHLLDDYIRHYSKGPLWHTFQPVFKARVKFAAVQLLIKPASWLIGEQSKPQFFFRALERLVIKVKNTYPQFDALSVLNQER